MTDFVIALSFIPLIFLAFTKNQKSYLILGGISFAVAGTAVGNSIYELRGEPLWWIPVASFIALIASQQVLTKRVRLMAAISAMYVSGALLSKDLSTIIVLLAFADVFFGCRIVFVIQ